MNALGFTIRKVKRDDHDLIRGVLAAAFGGDAEAGLVEALRASDAIRIERVAIGADGAVIGYCAFSEVTAEPAMDGFNLGLAPVAVAPIHQNQGVGSALVEGGLNLCREHGAGLVVVLGERDYYKRFGFDPASDYRLEWSGGKVGDAFQATALNGDAPAAPKRVIHYPEAFDGL